MQGFNLTIQQYTPLIRYDPSDEWELGTTADNFFRKYNDGFKLTTANGSTATIDFTGTGVWYALHIRWSPIWLMGCSNQDIWRIPTQSCSSTPPYTNHLEILT